MRQQVQVGGQNILETRKKCVTLRWQRLDFNSTECEQELILVSPKSQPGLRYSKIAKNTQI